MSESARLLTSPASARTAPFALLGAMATLLTTASLAQQQSPDWSHDPHHRSYTPRLVVFDAPGATKKVSTLCGGACGTEALAMNDEGTIAGWYTSPEVVPYGFIRTPDGKFISLSAPKAGTGAYLNQGTVPYTINNLGVVGGQYEDANNVFHGFIRYPDNHYEVVDAPGADQTTDSGHGTQVLSNNDEGESAGIYVAANGDEYSFFRSRDGAITQILPEKGSTYVGVCEETCLNWEGKTVGSYLAVGENVYRGFVRTRDGRITTFAAPGAGTSQYAGTFVASISAEGDIAGYLADNNGLIHGFVRHCDGTFSKDFEIAGAALTPGDGTAPFAINAFGITTGIYLDSNTVLHGFERTPSDFVAIIDAPASAAGSEPGQGTRPSVNNIEGKVAGWTTDATGLQHGFLWIP